MGCDGGTIPTRDELVKLKKRPEQKDKDSVRLYKWQHCALSQVKLVKPIVACELGKLYNKEAIIEKLLNAKSEGEVANGVADHIKSLKDVKELQLTDNPSSNAKAINGPLVGDGYTDQLVASWICPITGLEMNGKFKFVFDWSDGRVLSERALKVVAKDEISKIAPENVIIMNPEEKSEDETLMKTNMEIRRAKAKADKKAAKESKKRSSPTETKTTDEATTAVKKPKSEAGSSKAKQENGTSAKSKPSGSQVQNDGSKSEVYKSIFSSHSSAQNRPKGHWVTFDPRYN